MAKRRIIKNKEPYRKVTTLMQRKLGVAFALITLCLALLFVRIIVINMQKGQKYTLDVLDNQAYGVKTIPYVRGQILDRNNLVLAYSPKVYNLIVDAYVLNDEEAKRKAPSLEVLAQCFPEIDMASLKKQVDTDTENRYIRVLQMLTEDEIADMKAILEDKTNYPNVGGIWFETDYTREYPFKSLASDIIGFTVKGGSGELGLEMYYNDVLSGTNGVITGHVNEEGTAETNRVDAINGNTIVTTLDYYIQSVAEKYVNQYNEEYGSKATGVVVMNPKNGEIYAMVDYPTFDLNNPRDLSILFTEEEIAAMTDEEVTQNLFDLWRNFCVSNIYEPGSVIKPLTVGTGLDEGALDGTEVFLCDGYETVGGHNVHCDRTWGHGNLTLEQSIMFSCNDCLMQIAAIEGPVMLSKYQAIFGFGQKTGIDLPGEELGLVYTADKMTDVDLYTNSFGQNMNTTMVQVASAFSSLINGGYYYKPHLLKSILNDEGVLITDNSPQVMRRTVSETTSETLRKYLFDTVEEGTATLAQVKGYTVGGKTGTAEKYPREDNLFLLSFIGFAPYDDPEVVVYVCVDEPQDENMSHSPSAKNISSQIMTDILPYLNVKKRAE